MNWLKNGVELSFRIRPAGLALAALYAVTCWATWRLSVDQFFLPAGIRVAALLLCPKRMWPYLMLGEYAYFAQMRYSMVEEFGLSWVILGSACLMPCVALVVHLHGQAMRSGGEGWLLSVAASSALMVTALKLGLSHLLWPTPPSMPFYSNASLFVLGDYIAILTVAPLALLWMRRCDSHDWSRWRRPSTVTTIAVLSVMGGLIALLNDNDHGVRAVLQLLLVLPVIALTCMHGWRGAALGVPLMNIILIATMPTTGLPSSFDETTFFTQQVIAITSTALIALGSGISHHYHQHARGRVDAARASAFSRSAHLVNEQDLRERAQGLRAIVDDLEQVLGQTVHQLRARGHDAPASDLLQTFSQRSQQFREMTSMLYPTELEHAGLYVALQAGGVREAWNASHRFARPVLGGDPCQLGTGLQLGAYRVLAEAVSLLLKEEQGQIQVRARCGRFRGRHGIVFSVALLDRYRSLASTTCERAINRLSARAHAYDGGVQCRRNRIRVVMLEIPADTAPDSAPSERHGVCRSAPAN